MRAGGAVGELLAALLDRELQPHRRLHRAWRRRCFVSLILATQFSFAAFLRAVGGRGRRAAALAAHGVGAPARDAPQGADAPRGHPEAHAEGAPEARACRACRRRARAARCRGRQPARPRSSRRRCRTPCPALRSRCADAGAALARVPRDEPANDAGPRSRARVRSAPAADRAGSGDRAAADVASWTRSSPTAGWTSRGCSRRRKTLQAKCGEFGVMGSVVGDPSRPRGHHLRVQARRRRQVLEDRRPRRRPGAGAGGRVDPHRPHERARARSGIEIPNEVRETISLREILESDAFRKAPSRLTLALGKTVSGETYVTDLATMPHLLIAGATGTGKSVGLNCMIASILYKAHAGRGAPDPHRPQAPRARRLRGHPAPADAGGDRPQDRRQRPQVGGGGDGEAHPQAGLGGRAQHRAVQQHRARPSGARRERGRGAAARCTTS